MGDQPCLQVEIQSKERKKATAVCRPAHRVFLEKYTKCCYCGFHLETILFEIFTVIVNFFSNKKV